jgi:hypothetical protein
MLDVWQERLAEEGDPRAGCVLAFLRDRQAKIIA